MQGGLANEVGHPSVTEVATGQQPAQATSPADPREAGGLWSDDVVRLGNVSLTLEELLAIAIIAQTIMTGVTMFLEVSD